MPSFKPKSNKKIKFNKKSAVTLDIKHTEIINEFDKDENDRIPELKYERSEFKKQLQNDKLTVEQRLDIEDQIQQINLTIKETKIKKKEYYLDNSKYIFEYFENKKNISSGANINTSNSKTNLINSFFKIKTNEDDNELKVQRLDKTIRYYASLTSGGLTKSYTTKNKTISMLKRTNVKMFNDYSPPPHNVDYDHYLRNATELLYRISGVNHKELKGTKSKSGHTGKLFDNIE
jgi:hypothetical protein